MINLIQRSLRPILIVVFIVISASFVFFTAGPVVDRNTRVTDVGKIDGHAISLEQFQEVRSSVYAILTLRYGNQIPDSADMRNQVQQETWERLLIMSSAKKLGVEVDDSEILNFIRSLPALQKDGQYVPERYEAMIKSLQQSMGISEDRFTDIIRNELVVEKVQGLIVSPVHVAPADIEAQFNLIFGSVTMGVINFSAKDYLSKVTVDPQEIEQLYKAQVDSNPEFRTKERRRVSYIVFPLSAAEQKLPDAQKEEVRRKIGDKALEFALALEPEPDAAAKRADFAETAKKYGLTVATTGFFAVDEPSAPLPPSPNLNSAAFKLSKDHPTSSVVEAGDGFYVLKLEETAPSQPLPLDQVRSKIEDEFKNRRAMSLLQDAGRGIDQKIKTEMTHGSTFAAAAAKLGLKVETLPSFVPGDPKLGNDTKLALVRRLAMSLRTGGVSEFTPTATGGVIVSLDSRLPADHKAFADMETRLKEEMANQARSVAFQEWVRWRSTSPGTVIPQPAMQ